MKKILSRTSLVVALVILLTLITAAPAMAFNARSGDVVTVGAGETVNGDLYIAGRDLIIDGTVNGDVFGAGQNITVNGTINGGLTVAGQMITVGGTVTEGARIAGQAITLRGNINRDAVVAGATILATSTSRFGSDLVVNAGSARIEGQVSGSIRGSSGDVTVAGPVGGSVVLVVQALTLAPTAAVQGSVTYTSSQNATVQQGARINGSITRQEPQRPQRQRGAGIGLAVGWILWRIFSYLAAFVIGLILILLFAPRLTAMALAIRDVTWMTLGWGALILFVTPIAAIAVMVTIIGIPLALLMLVLYAIAVYLSQIPVALLVGGLILRRGALNAVPPRGLLIGLFALGLLILELLRAIPFIGWLIGLAIALFGLGTLVTAYRRYTR